MKPASLRKARQFLFEHGDPTAEVCASPLSRLLIGAKRTLVGALHMSAYDPKQTQLVRADKLFHPKPWGAK